MISLYKEIAAESKPEYSFGNRKHFFGFISDKMKNADLPSGLLIEVYTGKISFQVCLLLSGRGYILDHLERKSEFLWRQMVPRPQSYELFKKIQESLPFMQKTDNFLDRGKNEGLLHVFSGREIYGKLFFRLRPNHQAIWEKGLITEIKITLEQIISSNQEWKDIPDAL